MGVVYQAAPVATSGVFAAAPVGSQVVVAPGSQIIQGQSATMMPATQVVMGGSQIIQGGSQIIQPAAVTTYAAAPIATASGVIAAGGSSFIQAPTVQTYSAPMCGQPVYDISPERFQRIMAGEPLTNEEIAQMIGGGSAVMQTVVGGSAAF